MTTQHSMFHDPALVPVRERAKIHLLVAVARILAKLKPARLRSVLTLLRTAAAPASFGDTSLAYEQVTAVSYACVGPRSCLLRSIAITLLCRSRGQWPTWRVGVRRLPPVAAHSWVEAEGRPVGESFTGGYYSALMSVPPD
ncbi:lasso peptide biosynthesis B2 protein [Nocardia mexicana]|uniref:Transglutaminase superfamily protein n=1 Tax=Nocardia mexicana TaxID=279262 RepID=A0A370H928_9NOCA|nr:lasso peptide biosynthesis B2 protein [Nocardia mexicana]RDI53182.1 transglutaminase superfamily protein [Nocardia mexicana]